MSFTEIIIHHSGTKDLPAIDTQSFRDYHKRVRLWRDLGYHFVVEKIAEQYEVVVGRMLNETGAHAVGHNSSGIGICLAGNFDQAPPPFDQLLLAARLVAGLHTAIPTIGSIGRHNQVDMTDCPGVSFPWDQFLLLVHRELEGARPLFTMD